MNKTEKEILARCRKEGGLAWLSSAYFFEKIDKSRDTIAKNLKGLFARGILERKVISKAMYFTSITTWQYYYRLKKLKEAK